MSSRELEDRQQRDFDAWVASRLGVTTDELDGLDWSIDEIDGNDGAVYGHRVTIDEESDPDVLAKIKDLHGDLSIDIGFPPEEEEPDAPD